MAQVKHRIGIAGAVGKIFAALHEPAGLAKWWASSAEGGRPAGRVLDLHFSGLATLSFRIDTLTPDTRLQMTCVSGPGPWQGSSIAFTLDQDTDQVWLTLVHENTDASDDDFLYFATKWPIYLLSLRDFIEAGAGRPYPNEAKIHVGD